jgi:hypothetical protein
LKDKLKKASKMVYIDKDILHAYMITSPLTMKDLGDMGLLKSTAPQKLDFEPSKSGEGYPTKLELEYKGNIKALYKPVAEAVKRIKDKSLTEDQVLKDVADETTKFIDKAEKVVDEYIPIIFKASAAAMVLHVPDKLSMPAADNEILAALIKAQKYDIYKHATIAMMNVTGRSYWKDYFVKTYAKTKKPKG